MRIALPTVGQRRDVPVLALFLVTSVVVALVAGFGLGWWLILYQSFGVPMPAGGWLVLVQVHGHLQLMGFAGLLVMGIGYRLMPRFRGSPEPERRLVLASYLCVTIGVALRVAQLAQPSDARTALLLLSGALEVAGSAIYATTTMRTLALGDNAHRADELLMAGGAVWLPIAAMWSLVSLQPLFGGASLASLDADAAAVAAFLIGTVGGHILGVSVRLNSGFIAAKLVPDNVLVGATALWMVGTFLVVLQIGGGAPLLLAAAIALFTSVGIFGRSRAARPLPEHAQVTMFAWRAAYIWLVIGLALLTVDAMVGGAPSFVVAGRHALAIGFLGSMAYGVGARLLPTLTGGPALPVGAVRWAVILTNLAAALRAFVELVGPATTPAAVALALSGPVGLAGLLVFAAAAVRTVRPALHTFA
ncbi:MAG: NnrS family protein [Chloroflexota bacterium]|nr:NnrS family protein [Chloroflexota bacterium]